MGFLLLDLLRYAVHRCEHAVPLFWRFHALHHSDPDVDVTTAVRHHPIEYVPCSAVYLARRDRARYPRRRRSDPWSRGFRHGCRPARQHSAARAAWSGGCSRCWSRSTCTASTTPSSFEQANSQLRGGPLGMGSAFRDLHEHQPRTARVHRLRRPRIAAARLPEAVRDAPHPLADFPCCSYGLTGPLSWRSVMAAQEQR